LQIYKTFHFEWKVLPESFHSEWKVLWLFSHKYKRQHLFFVVVSFLFNFVGRIQCPGSAAGAFVAREESPGSTGRSTSENGSCWRQQEDAEENNRRADAW